MEKTYHILIGILSVGLVVALLILAFNAKQTTVVSGQDIRNTILVSGNSELTVEPDKAEIYVNIETIQKTAKEAKDENARVSKNVRDSLKRAGIKEEDFETAQFTISPRYEYDRVKETSELIGYIVTHVLKVTTTNLDKVGDFIDISVNNGANQINNVVFSLTKEKQKDVNGEAMIRASKVAKEKAEALATNLGVRLGKISSISESSFDYIPYISRGFAKAEIAEAPITTEISPQYVTIRAAVNIAYEII